MKKIFIMTLSVAALLTSCQVDEPAARGDFLYACMEETETKTYLEEGKKVCWSEGDRITAFMKTSEGVEYQVSDESVGNTEAIFEKMSEDALAGSVAMPHNVAFYPSSLVSECDMSGEEYVAEVTLPDVQEYAENSFGGGFFPMAAVSESNDFTFRNICGCVKIRLQGDCNVRSVKIEGKNREKLSGAATVTAYHGGAEPKIEMASTASSLVVLDCGEGVRLDKTDHTDFLIVLPPVEFEKGFEVTVCDDKGTSYVIGTAKSNEVCRSSVLVMPVRMLSDSDLPASDHLPEYIDEYGVNHSSGVKIGETIWAPVNCGYHESDYPWGKLYQWRRRYGQGYSGPLYDLDGDYVGEVCDAMIPEIEQGCVSLEYGQAESRKNVFFIGGDYYHNEDWLNPSDNHLWNRGTDKEPIKSEYDPCPDGWRVPTEKEFKVLINNFSPWTIYENQPGFWFTGPEPYSEDVSRIFLPAAGERQYYDECEAVMRGEMGFYWSSYINERNDRYASLLSFTYTYDGYISGDVRSYGASVRCVYDTDTVISPEEDIPVSEVNLNTAVLKLYEGAAARLAAEVIPVAATHKTVTWDSSSPSVATVDQDGLVTAPSAGSTVITAVAGQVSSECLVSVSEPLAYSDYVDEYGVDHGKGIAIGMTIWAPVNCGYKAKSGSKNGYTYGKLYQWGRKYGQGDVFRDENEPDYVAGGVSLEEGQSPCYGNTFFYGESDWLLTSDDALWNRGTEDEPVKAQYDPCPDGWRVPAEDELTELLQNRSALALNDIGQYGVWYSGFSSYADDVPQVFLPAAGCARSEDGRNIGRGSDGHYWSSSPTGTYAYCLDYTSLRDCGYFRRAFGLSVRCVQE